MTEKMKGSQALQAGCNAPSPQVGVLHEHLRSSALHALHALPRGKPCRVPPLPRAPHVLDLWPGVEATHAADMCIACMGPQGVGGATRLFHHGWRPG